LASIERPNAPSLRVLVVEDEPDTAQTWVWLLERLGHEVATAGDGPTALRAAEACRPDVVLLDLGLPGMSGYEVAAELRRAKDGKRPLLIAVTGFGDDSQRLHSYEVGVDLHLVKPVEIAELTVFLERFQAVRARR
jgi:CheY-like chemotaxis protein